MARLPTTQRIRREDIPDAPGWVDRLIYSINLFFEAVYSALNKQLTLQDNLAVQIRKISFVTSATYSSGDFDTIAFTRTLATKAFVLLIGQITEVADNYTPITEGVSPSWRDINNEIQITHMSGLKDDTRYNVTVIIF